MQLLCRCRPPPAEGHGPRDPLDRQTNAARLDNTSYYTIQGEHWHRELLFPSLRHHHYQDHANTCHHHYQDFAKSACERPALTSTNIEFPFSAQSRPPQKHVSPTSANKQQRLIQSQFRLAGHFKTSHRIHACKGQHSRRHWSGISHHGHQPEHPRALLEGFRRQYRLQAKISANTSFKKIKKTVAPCRQQDWFVPRNRWLINSKEHIAHPDFPANNYIRQKYM